MGRSRSSWAGGAASAMVLAVAVCGVSACSGSSEVECTGGAYEAECHPVNPAPTGTPSATVSPGTVPAPRSACPSDWSEIWKQVRDKKWDQDCPLPSPMTSAVPSAVPSSVPELSDGGQT